MYPLRFDPIYQPYVWGGKKIPKLYHRKAPPLASFAESWEISDRLEAMSVVANGPWKGKTLSQLIQELQGALLGEGVKKLEFPLLLKIIDAKENLSIQVHPDEAAAARFQGEAKTEAWIALEKSHVLSGFKKGVTQEIFKEAEEKKQVEKLLERYDLQKGDAIFTPGGRVHAILADSLIYEIQQNSNTTYRLYDWGRKKRELHLEKGLASIHWDDSIGGLKKAKLLEENPHVTTELLIECPYFVVERGYVKDLWKLKRNPKTFQIFFCVEGEAILRTDGHKEPFLPGMTYLIPACLESIQIEGRSTALRIFIV